MRRSSVNLADKIFPIEYVEEWPLREGINPGIMFRIIDADKDEVMGCIAAYISTTTLAIWNNKWGGKKVVNETLPDLFAAILPHIPISENIHNIHNLYALQGGTCYKVVIDSQTSSIMSDSSGTHIRAGENPEELVKRIVYSGKLTDESVEKEILKLLYTYRLESHNTKLLVGDIQNSLFIPEGFFSRCIDYLKEKGYVDILYDTSQTMVSASITVQGIEYVRNNFKTSAMSQVVMGDQIVGGDKISASSTGDNSPVIIKSQGVNLINQNIEKLEYEIEHNYAGEDKRALLKEVEEVKQLLGDKKNHSKITSILGGLLSKTSDVATIASTIIQLLPLFKG